MAPRLLVIQHNLDDGLNELGAPLAAAGLYLDVWDTRLQAEPPHPVSAYDGIVTLGGLNSAADEAGRPVVTTERELLSDALASSTPILGICFGAQLLARAAGGASYRADRAEIGWCTVDLDPLAESDALLGGLPRTLSVFQYHDDTFELPDGATVLGRNGDLLQAYRLGANAWVCSSTSRSIPARCTAGSAPTARRCVTPASTSTASASSPRPTRRPIAT